jgi:hypothetical protein
VVTFQSIATKYPEVDRRGVLADLADWSGEPGNGSPPPRTTDISTWPSNSRK